MQQYQCCLNTVSLYGSIYPQITRRHYSKFSVAPMSILTSQNNSTVSSSVVFDSHRRVGRLPGSYSQLHCLSRLNPFIPCVCAFIYLSSSIIFTEDTSSSSHAVVNHARAHVNIPEYTEHFRMYTDLGNQGATNAG